MKVWKHIIDEDPAHGRDFFAAKMGVSVSMLSDLYTGRRKLQPGQLKALSKAVKVRESLLVLDITREDILALAEQKEVI